MDRPSIVALVPMRHDSERVPGKNYRPFAGRPLFHHIVIALVNSNCFSKVAVDTDSPQVIADLRENFPEVLILERPIHLRDGAIPMNDVLMHSTSQLTADYYLQTHCTNPLLTSGTISRAIQTFLSGLPEYDSLFSVKRLQTRLWTAGGVPLNHDPDRLVRTQDLPMVYEENSCIYIFDRQTLKKRANRIGERPLHFEMDLIESWDIDEEIDFRTAELIFLNREQLGVSHI